MGAKLFWRMSTWRRRLWQRRRRTTVRWVQGHNFDSSRAQSCAS
jgi:hypothetical protein